MSTDPHSYDGSAESLGNSINGISIENVNKYLDSTPYSAERVDEGLKLVKDEGEYVGTYESLEEFKDDLVEMSNSFDGMYGFFENGGSAVIFGRWSGDNLIESTEHLDLEDMR